MAFTLVKQRCVCRAAEVYLLGGGIRISEGCVQVFRRSFVCILILCGHHADQRNHIRWIRSLDCEIGQNHQDIVSRVHGLTNRTWNYHGHHVDQVHLICVEQSHTRPRYTDPPPHPKLPMPVDGIRSDLPLLLVHFQHLAIPPRLLTPPLQRADDVPESTAWEFTANHTASRVNLAVRVV